MTQHQGPPQLKSGQEAPQELRHALRALGKQHTNPARLARAVEKLDTRLESAPATWTGSSAKLPWLLHLARDRVVLTRLAIGLLAVGGGSAALLSGSEAVEKQTVSPPRFSVRHVPPQADEPASLSSGLLRAEPSAAPAQPPVPSAGVSVSAQPHDAAGRSPLKGLRQAKRPRIAAAPTRPSAVPAVSAPVRSLSTPSVAAAGAGSALPVAAAAVRPAPSRALSEIELLFAARQKLPRDTRGGLRLLDEHRARFPDGQLAPEREVLAIEALRKLGQTDAAAKRFAAFRARNSDSLHLQRLEQPE